MRAKSLIGLTISIAILLMSVHELTSSGTQRENPTAGSLDSSWLYGWPFRKAHNITGSTAGIQTNYPILLSVHYDNGYDVEGDVYLSGKCRTDFGDVRFTDSAGTSSLSYYMQQKVDGVYAVFWVRVNYISASPDYITIYIYYGNSTATTTSNKDWVFTSASDFEDGTIQGWGKSFSSYVEFDGVSTVAFQGIYSRLASRNYGFDRGAGTGDFYERFVRTAFLVSGNYRIECVAKQEYQDASTIPRGIALFVEGAKVDEVLNPGMQWKWLSGNFTVSTAGWVEFDVEFHIEVAGSVWNVRQGYWLDNAIVRKWSDPEPAHGSWGSEAAWMGPPLGDVNGDGKVDVQDLRIVGKDYGKQYP